MPSLPHLRVAKLHHWSPIKCGILHNMYILYSVFCCVQLKNIITRDVYNNRIQGCQIPIFREKSIFHEWTGGWVYGWIIGPVNFFLNSGKKWNTFKKRKKIDKLTEEGTIPSPSIATTQKTSENWLKTLSHYV